MKPQTLALDLGHRDTAQVLSVHLGKKVAVKRDKASAASPVRVNRKPAKKGRK